MLPVCSQLRKTLALTFILGLSGFFLTGCLAETRAGVGGDGGMRGGSFSSARGQYDQHPTESKHYLKHALNN